MSAPDLYCLVIKPCADVSLRVKPHFPAAADLGATYRFIFCAAGEELAYSYGKGYWRMISDHLQELEEAEALAAPLVQLQVLERKLKRCFLLFPEMEEVLLSLQHSMQVVHVGRTR